MFGTIRKHSQWMWLIIIAVIIVSFVIFFTPNVNMSGGSQSGQGITVDGRYFSDNQVTMANREVGIGVILGFTSSPASNEESNQRILQRLLLEVKMDKYGIAVGPDTTAAWIRDRIMYSGGPFSGMTLDQVADQVVVPAGYTADDLTRFARNQAGIEILLRTIGVTAQLVTPMEIESAYRSENEKMYVDVAFAAYSNRVASVTLDSEEVMKFYSNRVAAYRSPDRIRVYYVHLASSNYVAEADASMNAGGALDSLVTQTFQSRGTNAYPDLTEEEARAEIRAELVKPEALNVTRRQAYDFINKYYDAEVRTADAMRAAADEDGLEMKYTEPFASNELPEGMNVDSAFVTAAFNLTTNEPYSTAVAAADGYYALCYGESIPGAVQSFEEVRSQVEEDYVDERARSLTDEAAEQFYMAATNAVAAGLSFVELAETSEFQVSTITNLTLSTSSAPGLTLPVSVLQIASIANNMETNSVSRPQDATDGLYLIHLGERTPPTEEEVAAGLAEYRSLMSSARETEVINGWMTKQLELSGVYDYFSTPTE